MEVDHLMARHHGIRLEVTKQITRNESNGETRMSDREVRYEVVVVGAGNAGLAAAITAADCGVKVAMMEKAPKDLRGGNTYFTGDFRFGWSSLDDHIFPLFNNITEKEKREMREIVNPYSEENFYEDVMRLTGGYSAPELAQVLVTEAYSGVQWLRSLGHDWIPDHHNYTYSSVAMLNGGGARLSDHNFSIAAQKGIDIRYQNIAMELLRDPHGRVIGVYALTPEGFTRIYAKAVVLACGGFEANAAMRTSYLGPEWDRVKIRGVPFNTGDGLRMAWDIGAQPYGNLSGCHATPQDIDRPPYSVRTQTKWEWSRYAWLWGITVNIHGQRFCDEGRDTRPYTYAKMGREIMAQPNGIAFQIFDGKMQHLILQYGGASGGSANTLEELAHMLGLEPGPFIHTIQEFNKAVQAGTFNPRTLDGKHTAGLGINKTNWAMSIDTPPFHGYGVCNGLTFTYGGLHITPDAQVMSTWETPIPGLYACGEIVGGLWYDNYPGASGMTAGLVFGRRAGRSAAKLAKEN